MRHQLGLLALGLAACHPTPPPAPPTEVASAQQPPSPSRAIPIRVDPPDPPTKVEGDVTDAWVRGIHVIVKRIPGAGSTATQLYVRGGVRNWDKTTAGIEQLAFSASVAGGTESTPRDAFTERLADLGSSLDGYATNDFSAMNAWCLAPVWDDTFAMLVDAFRHPALPPAIVDVQRARQLAGIEGEEQDADGKLAKLVHLTVFRGHPYENRAVGTLENVRAFTIDQLKAHLGKLRETSRLLIVVVGEVDPPHVIETIGRALGDLPRGTYHETPLAQFEQPKASVTIVEQKLPTNYIQAVFPGPTWREPEQLIIGRVAMNLLHEREFEEVRTKRNLSYAPSAFFNAASEAPWGGLYVTAVDPNTTMKVMFDEAKRLRDQPVPEKELASTKASFLTAIFEGAEAPDDQATQLAQAQLRGGDWRLVRTLADRVRAVTVAQIQAWAQKYAVHLHTFVIGDPTKVDTAALEAF